MTPRLFILGSALSLFAGAAIAADADEFEALDTDNSGGLSASEVQAAAPNVTGEEFAQYDSDGSGELSLTEYQNWKSADVEPQERY